MASVSTFLYLKSRLYSKSRLFNVKFNFGHKILYIKSRLYVKSRFPKSRLYCNNYFAAELKCVVLGNEGVGKTCLIAKFTTDLFPCEEKALDESSAVLEVPRSNGTMDRSELLVI